MSIVSVNLDAKNRRARRQSDGTVTYTMPYVVVTDSILDGSKTVRDAIGLPAIGSTYSYGSESDPYAYCISKEAEPIDDSLAWIVTVTYTNNLGGSAGSLVPPPQDPNPLLRPATYRRGGVLFSRKPRRDRNGTLIRNAASDEYSDLPEVPDSHYQIQITKNTATFSDTTAGNYIGAVNSDTFLGREARHWMCMDFTGEGPIVEGIYAYWVSNVTILLNYEGWDLELLEQGYRVIRSGQAFSSRSDSTEITTPQLLAADGTELPALGAPVYRTWEISRQLPFSALGLF